MLQDTEQGERKGEGVGRAYGFGFARINLFVWPTRDGGVCRQDLLETKVLLNKNLNKNFECSPVDWLACPSMRPRPERSLTVDSVLLCAPDLSGCPGSTRGQSGPRRAPNPPHGFHLFVGGHNAGPACAVHPGVGARQRLHGVPVKLEPAPACPPRWMAAAVMTRAQQQTQAGTGRGRSMTANNRK